MPFDPSFLDSLIRKCKTLYDGAVDVEDPIVWRRQLLNEVRSLEPKLEALLRLATSLSIVGDQALMDRLWQLLGPSQQPFPKVVERSLAGVENVLSFGRSSPNASRSSLLIRLWWILSKEEVNDLVSDIQRYKSQIGYALQDDMFKQIITGYCLKVAKFISDEDFTARQSSLIEQRLKNTGIWLIQDPKFVAWRDNIGSSRTLWCYGHPGAGKSVMAASIVDHLQSLKDAVVLSVFSRYSEPDTFTTPYPFLCGLLRQLIENSPHILPAIDGLYRTKQRPDPDTLSDFLAEMAASHSGKIYIVIDTPDECQIVLDLLRTIRQLGPSFRILVTSRPIFQEIYQHPSIKICASDHDILVAVDATLMKLKGAWLDDALKNTIRAKIVEKADGIFLLASLQLRQLESHATRRLDVVAILDSLPRSLDDAYKQTFQRIREQGEQKKESARHALALITLSSLAAEDVQHLIARGDVTAYADIETILQCCQGLVCKPSPDTDYRFVFIHYSVHEYVVTHWPELFPQNRSRSWVCLDLAYSILTSTDDDFGMNVALWCAVVSRMREPDELEQVISLLKEPKTKKWLLDREVQPVHLVDDPLLIACYFGHWNVVRSIVQTATTPDVKRFNEALLVSQTRHRPREMKDYINARPDLQVNSDGVVVAVADAVKGIEADA